MPKRVLFLLLALAATLLALTCARQEQGGRGPGSAQWRQDAYNRYVILDFKLRRVFYMANTTMARINNFDKEEAAKMKAEPMKESSGVTRSAMMVVNKDSTDAYTTAADATCDSLLAVIAAIEAEIARLESELTNLETQAAALKDGTIALARIGGMSKDLSEIEDEVKSVKEGGGGAYPGVSTPTSCDEALAKLEALQTKLSEISARVDAMKAKIAAA